MTSNIRHIAAFLASPVVVACAAHKPVVENHQTMIVGVQHTPPGRAHYGPAALAAFHADVLPVDSAGECSVQKSIAGGPNLVYSVAYPSRKAGLSHVAITIDSGGRMIRASEMRGHVNFPNPKGMADTTLSRMMREAQDATRRTYVYLDYTQGEGHVSNEGGGLPSEMVMAKSADIEMSASVGEPGARIKRAMALCKEHATLRP
ncbi:MAG: hypothetical protein JWO05_1470 [Gemmatimonadetes bacterium]|nr:hypothetical protein [Gemmatimonadota bacterium]